MKTAQPIRIPFGQWLPDRSAIENAGLVIARNVLPVAGGYRPAKDILSYSTALSARCRGLYGTKDLNGDPWGFAGDASKLYSIDSGTWSDVSAGGGYALTATQRWEFTKFDLTGLVIACSDGANPQKFSIADTPDAAFSDLGGTATAGDGGTQLKWRHQCVFKGFLCVGYTVEGTAIYHNKVKWSGIDDPEDWVISPSTTGSDEQILADGIGEIRRVVAGPQAWFTFFDRSIHRADYIGGRYVFQFNRLTDQQGAASSGSVVQVGGTTYFLDRSGFYALDGSLTIPLGKGKVDRYFLEQSANLAYLDRMSCGFDPDLGLVVWAFVSQANTSADPWPDRLMVFSQADGRFTEIRLSAQIDLLGGFTTQSWSVDGLAALFDASDDITPYTDSPFWKGKLETVGMVSSNHKLAYMAGDPLAATIETGEQQFFPGYRSKARRAWPLVDGGASSLSVGTRGVESESVSYGSVVAQHSRGHFPLASNNSAGRYKRFQLTTAAGTDFTQASGLDVEVVPMGRL